MRFGILGPLEIQVAEARVRLPSRQEESLLAMLLLAANRVVALPALIDGLGQGDSPATAKRRIHNALWALRRRLMECGGDAGCIVTDGLGIRIQVEEARLDSLSFEARLGAAREHVRTDPERATRLLHDALGLWRGPALAGLTGPAIEAGAARLDELRLVALELRNELGLSLDRHHDLVGELTELVEQHPTRERLVAQLMTALYRCDRQPEALQAFQRLSGVLAEDLGVDPSPPLQRLYLAIVRNDLEIPTRAAALPTASKRDIHPPTSPAQLPRDTPAFVGRSAALGMLDRLSTGEQDTPVAVISGAAGVGKTTLAVHWAHRARRLFPDGQLHVNLRGFDPAIAAVDPAEAIRGFLDALSVPPPQIPVGPDAQAALLRGLLTDRRMLVLLDNARDSEQVRPLLAAVPGCLVLVTSRSPLTALIANEAAHRIGLDVLSLDEAKAMVADGLGTERAASEPDAIDEIVARCARLPLALAIMTARAAHSPGLPLSVLGGEFAEAYGGLETAADDDPASGLRAVFSWSYDALDPESARLFRLFGLHLGPEVSAAAAASLAGLPPSRARELLAELAEAHLLDEFQPGRYRCHDLLRVYAAELATAQEPSRQRRAALHRLLDHYLHSACSADRRLDPDRPPIELVKLCPGTTPEELTSDEQAMSWFAVETATLLAIVREAATTGWDTHAWQITWAVSNYLLRRCLWPELVAAGRVAVLAAERHGDVSVQAGTKRNLALALVMLGEYGKAVACYEQALDLLRALGDRHREAEILCHLGDSYDAMGRRESARGMWHNALVILDELKHPDAAGVRTKLSTAT